VRPVNLGALFEMERRVRGLESAPPSPRSQEDAEEREEKWQFQAEMLCVECNFLRMEREVTLRKLDCHRGQMCGVCLRRAAHYLAILITSQLVIITSQVEPNHKQ
jgi:hypothetical protein